MGLLRLDSENADRNLTSVVTVLTHTVGGDRLCIGRIALGDGAKNLSGAGGNYELHVLVGGQTAQPGPQIIAFGTAVRAMVWTALFPVRDGEEVVLRVRSPNAGETDVDVTAELYDAAPTAVNDEGHVVPADGSLTEVKFGTDVYVYDARIEYREDAANETDHYTAVWFRNGVPMPAAAISGPTIRVVRRSNGQELIGPSAMDWDAHEEVLKYDATDTERNSGAEVLKVIVAATIDGAERSVAELVYRDV